MRCLEMGNNYCIQKPFDVIQIVYIHNEQKFSMRYDDVALCLYLYFMQQSNKKLCNVEKSENNQPFKDKMIYILLNLI